jgi:hypothetical protein
MTLRWSSWRYGSGLITEPPVFVLPDRVVEAQLAECVRASDERRHDSFGDAPDVDRYLEVGLRRAARRDETPVAKHGDCRAPFIGS